MSNKKASATIANGISRPKIWSFGSEIAQSENAAKAFGPKLGFALIYSAVILRFLLLMALLVGGHLIAQQAPWQ